MYVITVQYFASVKHMFYLWLSPALTFKKNKTISLPTNISIQYNCSWRPVNFQHHKPQGWYQSFPLIVILLGWIKLKFVQLYRINI